MAETTGDGVGLPGTATVTGSGTGSAGSRGLFRQVARGRGEGEGVAVGAIGEFGHGPVRERPARGDADQHGGVRRQGVRTKSSTTGCRRSESPKSGGSAWRDRRGCSSGRSRGADEGERVAIGTEGDGAHETRTRGLPAGVTLTSVVSGLARSRTKRPSVVGPGYRFPVWAGGAGLSVRLVALLVNASRRPSGLKTGFVFEIAAETAVLRHADESCRLAPRGAAQEEIRVPEGPPPKPELPGELSSGFVVRSVGGHPEKTSSRPSGLKSEAGGRLP